jgi:hypothetical protein
MELYLRTTSGHTWPAGYAGVDGLIAAVSQNFDVVMSSQAPSVGELWNGNGWRTLFVTDNESTPMTDGFRMVGYDAATLDQHGSVYSLLIHYLYNNRPAQRAGFSLNENCLLESRDDARHLINEWESWRPIDPGHKESLEHHEKPMALAVFRLETAS